MTYTKDTRALMWLSTLSGVGSLKKHAILSLVETPSELYDNFEVLSSAIRDVTDDGVVQMLRVTRDKTYLDTLVETLDKKRINAISCFDECYPATLRELADYPLLLYCIGDERLLTSPMLAVVGTREPSRYGKAVTEEFVTGLVKAGFTIVSGMARGIDSIAHEEALACGGKTVAILGCGADVVYPAENKTLYGEIAERGLIVSEYPPETKPMQYRFPERNRLISGVSRGVLVTEAGLNSGSLITASCAVEQNKRLFLVPGNITAKMSAGVNALIKTLQGAMVTEVNDILSEFGLDNVDVSAPSQMQLDLIEELILTELNKSDLHFDKLKELTGLSVKELNALLTKMELFCLIKKLVGNYYGV